MKFISVITPTYNSEKKISRCISSVINQNYNDYEHIIIDNTSSDQTLNIIQKFENNKIKVISENDKGIYYAMNKGINLASSTYLLFLNSDDHIVDKEFFIKASKILDNNNIDILYSNIKYEKNAFNLKRKFIPGNILNISKFGNHLPHPGTIINKKFIIKMNSFDIKYKISADFDFFMRCKKQIVNYYYYDFFTVEMSNGGASSGIKNIIKSNCECYDSLKINKIKFPHLFIFIKILKKFLQLF